MKKWGIIAAVTAFVIFAVIEFVHEFVANDPIDYFTREPRRLLYVAAIAVAGGFATWAFYRLSPGAKRWARILAWGTAASTMTVFIGYFVFRFLSHAPFIAEPGNTLWLLLLLLLFSCLAAYFWFECWRVWKAGASR